MATRSAQAKDRVGLSEIIGLPEFETLSGQQKAFISRYISSRYDALDAVHLAYHVSAKNAVGLASQLLGHQKIKRILDLHFARTGRTELDAIMPDLVKSIKRSLKRDKKKGGLSIATIKAMEFYERHTGQKIEPGVTASAVADPEVGDAPFVPTRVGNIRVQGGKKYRVTAIDTAGRPTAAVEIEE